MIVFRFLCKTHAAQSFDDIVLRVGLAGIDDVVEASACPKAVIRMRVPSH